MYLKYILLISVVEVLLSMNASFIFLIVIPLVGCVASRQGIK